jgi:hypothetical protein
MEVRTPPHTGAERFMAIDVHITEEPADDFDPGRLAPKGRAHFVAAAQAAGYRAVKGAAAIRWRSAADRANCERYQRGRGDRWGEVLRCARRLRDGELLRHGPVYLHPTLTEAPDGKLTAIDGTRRLMAALEAGLTHIDVVVIVPA